nr:unnamed protein product [Callosobruchus chinensis]
MESFLRVNQQTLPASPTNSFIADEVASICPLITPSPPTNALINPEPEQSESNFVIGEELAAKLKEVQDHDKADSASSSSSAEPACTQLLNHRNNYHHITKTEETEIQEANGKTQPLQLTFRNPPDNYFFMSWNWPLIRKISMWTLLAGLAAMVALVIAMISALPKTCNPPTQWYQGNLFYEIFPASFYSGSQQMEGDFKGISTKSDYLVKLGVRAVRLNSIFDSLHYPKDFDNVTSLTEIAKGLGDLKDFKNMASHLKSKNISLVLDLPVYPYVKRLSNKKVRVLKNETDIGPHEFLRTPREDDLDAIEDAILHWTTNGVDGFYLKGLEYMTNDPNLAGSLRRWKKILGQDRIIIVNEALLRNCPQSIINIVLNNVDLIDVNLDLSNGATAVSKQIFSLQNGTLFSKPGMPWIHWSIGNVYTRRLANILPYANGTLGATLLQLMLPGTPSIFYGDEIGLQEISDTDGERQDIKHLHQLTMMPWPNHKLNVLPWIYGGVATNYNFGQTEAISKMMALRVESPSVYMNAVYKEGINKANVEVKYAASQFLVLQRWYPRRKNYVVACNLGSERMSTDLSTLLYAGEIVVGPRIDSKPGTISFKDVSLWPGESVVIVLN